jgi:hypothetical protein
MFYGGNMGRDECDIFRQIRSIQQILDTRIDEKGLNDDLVYIISKCLDKIINEYYKIPSKKQA